MLSPDRSHVIVVGAGPTGLVTALGLARSGIPVTVLESEPAVVRSPRAVIYHWAVLDGLERLGLLDDAIGAGFTNPELCFIVLKTGERIRLNIESLRGEVTHPFQVHLGQTSSRRSRSRTCGASLMRASNGARASLR